MNIKLWLHLLVKTYHHNSAFTYALPDWIGEASVVVFSKSSYEIAAVNSAQIFKTELHAGWVRLERLYES